jgi:hypothetical protein
VQVYDIGDIDKTKLMIERINEVLDELKYTKTRVVPWKQTSATRAGNASLQLNPYRISLLYFLKMA